MFEINYIFSIARHVFLSAGGSFTEEMWQICAVAMEKALDVTTYYLQQLMLLFNINSENFYGDLGQVKVAMRKDSTPEECERLRHLAQQVCTVNYKLDCCAILVLTTIERLDISSRLT